MAAIHSNGGNRWNILGFNFTKRDALSSVYKISMIQPPENTSRTSTCWSTQIFRRKKILKLKQLYFRKIFCRWKFFLSGNGPL